MTKWKPLFSIYIKNKQFGTGHAMKWIVSWHMQKKLILALQTISYNGSASSAFNCQPDALGPIHYNYLSAAAA